MKKCLQFFVSFAIMFAVVPMTANAAEITTAETFVMDDKVYMYVTGVSDKPESVEYQIGTTKVEMSSIGYANPVKTVMLWDNSVSVMSKYDSEVRELLIDICASKSLNEVFAIYTINEDMPQKLCDYTNDYDTLKNVIVNTEVQNKEAYLIESLKNVVEEIKLEDDCMSFHRIIVISDGMDLSTSDVGVTRHELDKILEKNNYPIYTIGVNGKDEEALKEMFSLSRASGVSGFKFNSENIEKIKKSIKNGASVVGFECVIPKEVRNGSLVKTKLDVDGVIVESEIEMPFDEAITSVNEQKTDDISDNIVEKIEDDELQQDEDLPIPNLNKDEKVFLKNFIDNLLERVTVIGLITIISILVAFIAFVVIIVLLSRARKYNARKIDEERVDKYEKLDLEIDNQAKYQDRHSTEMINVSDEEATMLLFESQSESGKRIVLSSVENPDVSFSVTLDRTISIGRGEDNIINIQNDKYISKKHAEIYEMNGNIYIRDLGSANGTYMGPRDINSRISSPEILVNNVIVTIGQNMYSVYIN